MATFQIIANGTDFGRYTADTAEEAIALMYADAGYASPEAAAEACGVTLDAAHAQLVVSEVEAPHRCESGEATGERCRDEATTLVEWMPPHLRESHRAAGNSGVWPANGALRIRCCVTCAIELAEDGGREVGS